MFSYIHIFVCKYAYIAAAYRYIDMKRCTSGPLSYCSLIHIPLHRPAQSVSGVLADIRKKYTYSLGYSRIKN